MVGCPSGCYQILSRTPIDQPRSTLRRTTVNPKEGKLAATAEPLRDRQRSPVPEGRKLKRRRREGGDADVPDQGGEEEAEEEEKA